MNNVELDEMTYIAIGIFFINLKNQAEEFVYELLEDNSIQIYTQKSQEDLPFVLQHREWEIFKSIEVMTTNISSKSDIDLINQLYPELKVKKGFI